MPEKRSYKFKRVVYEFPMELYQKIYDKAQKDRRSILSTILVILEDYFNGKN